jgi:hypothetical protein
VRTRRIAYATIGATIALALLASPAGAGAAEDVWRVIPSPNPGGPGAVSNILFTGVSALGPSSAWGVGFAQIQGHKHPLVERWNGRAWQTVRVPEPPNRQSWFNGVVALSPSNVWAVGESTDPQFDNQDQQTFVEHWDGTAWSIVPSPNPGVGFGAANVLSGVSGVSADDLWAAGWVLDPAKGDIEMLMEHWDGAAWTVAPSPSPLGATQFAFAVTALSSDDAWAVGTDASVANVSAHWDGQRWSLVPTPSLHDGISPLNSLTGVTAAASDDVWASGFEGNVDNRNFMQPYMLHWDGSSWTLEPTPNLGGEGSRLNATVAVSADDVWATGQTQELDGSILTLTQQWDGTAWTTVPSPNPGGVGRITVNSLDAVTNAGNGRVFTLGSQEIPGQCCLRTLALGTDSG